MLSLRLGYRFGCGLWCARIGIVFEHGPVAVETTLTDATSARVTAHGCTRVSTELNTLGAHLGTVDLGIVKWMALEHAGVSAWKNASTLLITPSVDQLPVFRL
jgi:ribulose-5-phosphate 4-epimerase/fuculose-1-phosphate aldolase